MGKYRMINWTDFMMYVRYYMKTVYLAYLKTLKGLDYTGRIEDFHTQLKGYEGCYPVHAVLRKLAIVPSDSVLDIGCGKGLFLYYATAFDFGCIDGIEYADSLVQTAKKMPPFFPMCASTFFIRMHEYTITTENTIIFSLTTHSPRRLWKRSPKK